MEDSEQAKQDYQQICKYLGTILKKLASSHIFSQQIPIDIDQFAPLKVDRFNN